MTLKLGAGGALPVAGALAVEAVVLRHRFHHPRLVLLETLAFIEAGLVEGAGIRKGAVPSRIVFLTGTSAVTPALETIATVEALIVLIVDLDADVWIRRRHDWPGRGCPFARGSPRCIVED